MTKHPIIHVELSTHDRDATGKFYSELFGWEVQQMPEMNYATFSTGEGVGGGFNPISDDYPAGTITFYVQTDDVDTSLNKAEALGGKIIVPKSPIPGVAWFGMFRDPTGNLVAVMTTTPPEE